MHSKENVSILSLKYVCSQSDEKWKYYQIDRTSPPEPLDLTPLFENLICPIFNPNFNILEVKFDPLLKKNLLHLYL